MSEKRLSSRGYILTINNPKEHNFNNDDTVINLIESLNAIQYACFQLERGEHYWCVLCFI